MDDPTLNFMEALPRTWRPDWSEDEVPVTWRTVTVLGSYWRRSNPWRGLDFTRAEIREHSIFGADEHLRVPWCHPADQPEGWSDRMAYRVRIPTRQQSTRRFHRRDDGRWVLAWRRDGRLPAWGGEPSSS